MTNQPIPPKVEKEKNSATESTPKTGIEFLQGEMHQDIDKKLEEKETKEELSWLKNAVENKPLDKFEEEAKVLNEQYLTELEKKLSSTTEQEKYETFGDLCGIVAINVLLPLNKSGTLSADELKTKPPIEILQKLALDQSLTPEKRKLVLLLQATFKTDSTYGLDIDTQKLVWDKFIEKILTAGPYIDGAQRAMNGENPQTEADKKQESFYKKHPVATTIAVVAGAYGLYKIAKWIFGNDKKSDSKSPSENSGEKKMSWWKKIGLCILGFFGFGQILGIDTVKNLLKNLRLDIDNNKLLKVLPLAARGKFKEVFELLGNNAYNKLAKVFGWEKLKETTEKGMEWLEEKVNFTKFKTKTLDHLKKYAITAPEWLQKLSLSEIAATLGIDKVNSSTWINFAAAGGTAFLLYKYASVKNVAFAGLSLFLIEQGRGGQISSHVLDLTKQLTDTKNNFIKKLNEKYPGIEYAIPDFLENMKLEENIGNLFDWMKENPGEAMLILNGAWIFKGLLFKSAEKLAKVVVGYTAEHPIRSVFLAGAGFLAYKGRREILQDIVEMAYAKEGGLNSPVAQKTLSELYKYAKVDPKENPTLVEREAPSYLKDIFIDPARVLLHPGIVEEYKKGKFALGFDMLGRVFFTGATLTAPIMLSKLTWHSLSSAIKSIYMPSAEQSRLEAVAIGGAEILVLGSMAWKGTKAYGQLIEISAHSGSAFRKLLWSGIPLTKEWRFIWKSALSAPLVPLLKASYAKNIGVIESKLTEIEAAVNKENLNAAKDLAKKITKSDMFEDVTALRKKLNISSFSLDYFTRLDEIKQKLEALENAADTKNVNNMKAYLAEARKEIGPLKTWLSNTVTMCELLLKGKWKEAMDMMKVKAPAEPIMPKQAYKTPDIFKGKSNTELLTSHVTLKKEVSTLEKEIANLPEGEEKLQKLAKLKAAKAEFHQIDGFINKAGYKNISAEAAKVEKLAGPEKAKAVEELAEHMANTEKGFNARMAGEIEKITKMTDKKAQAAAAEAIQKEIDAFADTKLSSLKKLHELYYSVVKSGNAPKGLRTTVSKAVDNASETFSTRVIKGAKGRAKLVALMTVAMFATEHVMNKDKGQDVIDEIKSLGPEFFQLLLDVLPLTGTFSNFYSACSGKEIVTDRDVSSAKDRALNVVWGTVSLAGDVITVLTVVPSAGASIGGAAAARLTAIAAKGGRMAPIAARLLKMMPRIIEAADASGGFRNFAKRLKAPTKTIKALRKIEMVGMTAGTLMLAGEAVNAIYGCKTSQDTELPDFGPEIAGAETEEPPSIPQNNTDTASEIDVLSETSAAAA